MTSVEAVIFDLGRVLVGVDVQRGLFERLVDMAGADAESVLLRLHADEVFRRFNAGVTTPREFYAEVGERVDLDLSFETFATSWCEIFFPLEGMRELLQDVQARVSVGLLSDTDPLHWFAIRQAYPWINRIEKPTLSFEIGVTKPDLRAFAAAVNNVGMPAERCLFVDDLTRNVEGARSAGLQAERFTGCEALRTSLRRYDILD